MRVGLASRHAIFALVAAVVVAVVPLRTERPRAQTISRIQSPFQRTPAAVGDGPSFDCRTALKTAERAVCADPQLADLDRRLNAAYLTAQASQAPGLLAQQRAWIKTRNLCGLDRGCLRANMTERLAQLRQAPPAAGDAAAPSESATTAAATADSADLQSAATWKLPVLNDLPYVPRVEEVIRNGDEAFAIGYQSYEPTGLASAGYDLATAGALEGYAVGQAPAATQAWTRAIFSLGLAALPDLPAKLDDRSLFAYACMFIAPNEQASITGGTSCAQLSTQGDAGTVFPVHDLATAFKEHVLPGLLRSAPKLPLHLLIVLSANLSRYDLVRHRFDILFGGASHYPVRVFGSEANLVFDHPTWPLPEAEARRFVQSRSGEPAPRVYIAVPLILSGVIAAEASDKPLIDTHTGLPQGGRWRVEADRATLYADPNLRQALFELPVETSSMPSMDTSAASAPKPDGPLPLGADTALLLLLQRHVFNPSQVDWNRAAETRYSNERSRLASDQSPRGDPWGVFFPRYPKPDSSLVAAFRDWTLRRVQALPPSVYWTGAVKIQSGDPITLFGNERAAVGEISQMSFDNGVKAALQQRGLGLRHLAPVELYVPAKTPQILLAATPQERGDARSVAGLDAGAGAGAATDEGDLTLKVFYRVTGFDSIDSRIGVLRLQPLKADLERGSVVVASAAVPAMEWPPAPGLSPSAPAPRSALEVLGGGPYGPDITGIRLGMPFAEAEGMIAKELPGIQALETPPATAAPGQPPSWLSGKLYISQNDDERIAIFQGEGAARNRVVAIWRRILVPATPFTDAQVQEALKQKYGPPTVQGSRAAWSMQPLSNIPCYNGARVDWRSWLDHGRLIDIKGDAPSIMIAYTGPYSPANTYQACGTVVTSEVGQVGGAYSLPTPKRLVFVGLSDLRMMYELQAQSTPVPPPAAPAMKF